MNTNNGNEELRRALLMMSYNPSKTLTENVDEITSLLNEDVKEKAGLITEKGVKPKPHVNVKSKPHLNATGAINALKSERKALENAFDAELALAKQNGKKLPKSKIDKHQIDMVNKDVELFMNTPKGNPPKYPTVQEVKNFTIKKSAEVSSKLKSKVDNAFPSGGKTPSGGRSRRAQSKDFPKVKETNWMKFKSAIKDMARSKAFKYLVAAGGLYLAWKWYTSEDATPLPECITRSASPEDIEKMATQGLEYAVVTTTGNRTIDSNGGGLFFDDKNFSTGNGRYKGTWSEEGGKVVISIGSNQYPMDCVGTEAEPEDDGNGGGDGSGGGNGGRGSYKNCTSFPYEKGCHSSVISDIQGCVGASVDGDYGNKTEAALIRKGYDTTITQELYDKIMADCGKGKTTTTTTTIYNPERTSYGSQDT